MAEESFSERTEQATPRRREEARKKGRIAKSREIPSVLVLMAGVSVLFVSGAFISNQLSTLMVHLFKQVGSRSFHLASLQAVEGEIMRSVLLTLAPVLGVVLATALLGHLVQSGFLLSIEAMTPDWSKINFVRGFKQIFSMTSLAELLKSFLKMVVVGIAVWSTIKKEWPQMVCLIGQEPGLLLRSIGSILWGLLLKTGLVMFLLAGLDYLFQRYTYEKHLRMTKQELKEEFRMTEGDPLIKSRIRSIQRQMARRRMMAEVPKADVIITNPTHLAVALAYRSQEMEAPQVVAKGAGWIAEKIIEIGRSHHIPLVENKPLAQILYKTLELGQMIPSAFYHAVADILAYVYRIKNKIL